MVSKRTKQEKKIRYDAKLCALLEQFSQVLVCGADNVGSNQLQSIRAGLRPDSVVLMGKNTMMKRTIRVHAEQSGNTSYLNLIPLLVVRLAVRAGSLFTLDMVDDPPHVSSSLPRRTFGVIWSDLE